MITIGLTVCGRGRSSRLNNNELKVNITVNECDRLKFNLNGIVIVLDNKHMLNVNDGGLTLLIIDLFNVDYN